MANKVRPGPLARLVTNFMNSLKNGRHIDSKSQVVGEDYIGNRYFEIPADPSHGKRRPRRWFTSPASNYHDPRGSNITEGFDNEVPSEWESWLRNRRELPPTEAEILQSFAIADLKKRNAADLERKRIEELKAEGRYVGPDKPLDHEKTFFPKYDEYEVLPGEDKEKNNDRWKDFKNPYLAED
eukprot:07446.XXX_347454_346845_1 [CDS] Oithona nana genome sequencing.